MADIQKKYIKKYTIMVKKIRATKKKTVNNRRNPVGPITLKSLYILHIIGTFSDFSFRFPFQISFSNFPWFLLSSSFLR